VGGEVKVVMKADLSDVENKVGAIDKRINNMRINISTEQAEKSLDSVEKKINDISGMETPESPIEPSVATEADRDKKSKRQANKRKASKDDTGTVSSDNPDNAPSETDNDVKISIKRANPKKLKCDEKDVSEKSSQETKREPAPEKKESAKDPLSKLLADTMQLMSLGSKLKSGNIGDIIKFIESFSKLKADAISVFGMRQPKIDAAPPIAKMDEGVVRDEWDNKEITSDTDHNIQKKEAIELSKADTPDKHEQADSNTRKQDKTEDISSIALYVQEILGIMKREKVTGQADTTPYKGGEDAGDTEPSRHETKDIKDEISKLNADNTKLGGIETKPDNAVSQKEAVPKRMDAENIPGESKIAKELREFTKAKMPKFIDALGSGGQSASGSLIEGITGKISSRLATVIGKSLLGETGGAALGAAGTAGTAGGAAVAGEAAGTAGAAGAGALTAGSMAIPVAGVAIAAASIIGKKLWDAGKEGSSKALSSDEKVLNTFGSTNQYKSNLHKGSEEWYQVGKEYGYSTGESLSAADAYIKKAGFTNMENTKRDINAIEGMSRAYSMDPTQTADTAGSLNRMGVIKDGDQQKLANMFSEALKRNKMGGREDEQLDVLKSMAENLDYHNVTVSSNDLMGMMNLQSKMVEVNQGFKGEKGANVVSQLNEGIINGGDVVDRLLGWGTEYSGVGGEKGRWAFEQQKAKGIGTDSDEGMQNLTAIVRNFEKMTGKGANSDEFKMMLKQQFGLETDVIEKLMSDPKFVSFLKNSDEQVKELQAVNKSVEKESLPTDIKENLKSYQDSNLAAKQKNINAKENLSETVGNDWLRGTKIFTEADTRAQENRKAVWNWLSGKPNEETDDSNEETDNPAPKHAIGKDYVPYDKYRAELHKGEAVLTKAEADDWRSGSKNEYGITRNLNNASGASSQSSAQNRPTVQQKYQNELLDKELRIVLLRKDLYKDEGQNLDKKTEQQKDEERFLHPGDTPAASEQKPKSLFDNLMSSLGGLFGFGGNGASGMGGSSSPGSSGSQPPRLSSSSGQGITARSQQQETPTASKASSDYNYAGGPGAADTSDLTVKTKLRRESNVTAEQLNEIIDKNAAGYEKTTGRKSLFRGQGDAFIQASKATGINPIDILSQGALESGWGTSSIAYDKKNFFGIGAFDATPYASAYSFGGGNDASSAASAGIIEGAKWIAKNYVDKGQDSFYSMRWNNGVHQYATDPQYDTKVNNIRKSIYGQLPAETVAPAAKPKLAIGKNYIPYDGFEAVLHKGEAVLPRFTADKWRAHRDDPDNASAKRIQELFTSTPISLADNAPTSNTSPPMYLFDNIFPNNTSTTSTQNVNISVNGKILGMDKDNQRIVSSALRDYYSPDKRNPNAGIMALLENNSVRRQR